MQHLTLDRTTEVLDRTTEVLGRTVQHGVLGDGPDVVLCHGTP